MAAGVVVGDQRLRRRPPPPTGPSESARLRQGGPLRLDLPDDSAQAALTLTRRLDPDGRWLMAAAVNDARDEARYRTAWLDLERYDRVAADFLSSTSADVDARGRRAAGRTARSGS